MLRRNAKRKAVPQPLQTKMQHKGFPAPVRGLVTAENLAATGPASAQVLENFLPTTTGIKLRGGSPRYATIDESNANAVESLMSYIGGSTRKLFAADENNIYDITSPVDADTAPTAMVTGQSAGYYGYVNFATTGGNFMLLVNGLDDILIYDGTRFYPNDGTSVISLGYDNESGTFTTGLTVTGGTSGATGVIVAIDDQGTEGTLYLNNVSGTFQDNEALTDSSTGAADADGAPATYFTAITGGTTDDFTHVSVYRNRLYFTRGGTMYVDYLPADQIGGALGSLNLAGTFKRGGAIHFTATWSLDSGDGLDDKFVVISTEGEVAVFEGNNPSDSNTWTLVGVYEIPPCLGFNAIMRAGGDLIIATEGGMVPISAAVTKDPAALSLSAISRNIEPDWSHEVVTRRGLPWEIVKWPQKNLAYVSLPVVSSDNEARNFVVNLQTGAWAKYTGWNTRCFALHNDQVYFGSNDGTVKRAEIGGWDDEDTPYLCRYAGSWDHLGQIGVLKTIKQARSIWRTGNAFLPQLSGSVDYAVSFPGTPDAVANEEADSVWDVGLWDQALWDVGVDFYTVDTRWISIGKTGFSFAPQVQVTVGGANTPSAELAVFDVTYEPGGLVV